MNRIGMNTLLSTNLEHFLFKSFLAWPKVIFFFWSNFNDSYDFYELFNFWFIEMMNHVKIGIISLNWHFWSNLIGQLVDYWYVFLNSSFCRFYQELKETKFWEIEIFARFNEYKTVLKSNKFHSHFFCLQSTNILSIFTFGWWWPLDEMKVNQIQLNKISALNVATNALNFFISKNYWNIPHFHG